MAVVKKTLKELVENLPEDVSFADILKGFNTYLKGKERQRIKDSKRNYKKKKTPEQSPAEILQESLPL